MTANNLHPAYYKAILLSYSWQYVQPCKDGCLIINRAMENRVYDEGHQLDKLIKWSGEIHTFSPLE